MAVGIQEADRNRSGLRQFVAKRSDGQDDIGFLPCIGRIRCDLGSCFFVAGIREVGFDASALFDPDFESVLDELFDGLRGGCIASFSRASLFRNEYFDLSFGGLVVDRPG